MAMFSDPAHSRVSHFGIACWHRSSESMHFECNPTCCVDHSPVPASRSTPGLLGEQAVGQPISRCWECSSILIGSIWLWANEVWGVLWLHAQRSSSIVWDNRATCSCVKTSCGLSVSLCVCLSKQVCTYVGRTPRKSCKSRACRTVLRKGPEHNCHPKQAWSAAASELLPQHKTREVSPRTQARPWSVLWVTLLLGWPSPHGKGISSGLKAWGVWWRSWVTWNIESYCMCIHVVQIQLCHHWPWTCLLALREHVQTSHYK